MARGADDLARLGLAGAGHVTIAADVSTADGAARAIDGTVDAFGGLDVVVAVAGKSFARTVAEMDDDDLGRSLDINLWTAARVARRALPHLRTAGGGSIVLLSSIWGREAGGAPGYNVAKAAVIALGKALAREVAADGIRVNTVAPEDGVKNYFLFLPKAYLKDGAGTVLTLTLRGLQVSKAEVDPAAPGGVAAPPAAK